MTQPMTLLLASPLLGLFVLPASAREPAAPEDRALAYLVREVPQWSAENGCFSCHNNAVAARALLLARQLGYSVPDRALADTMQWLTRPARWDENGGEEAFSDKRLARVQFAAALASALETGLVKDRAPLRKAAALVASEQGDDGSWPVDTGGSTGSPATLGTGLSTFFARETLRMADSRRYRHALDKAEQWFLNVPIHTPLDAAACLLALDENVSAKGEAQKRRALALLRKGEAKDGGWGPFVNSAPEPFDTAVVLLALARQDQSPGLAALLRRGRAYLCSTQLADGSWPETTRPAGGESYAQRVATAGWATLALLRTGGKKSD